MMSDVGGRLAVVVAVAIGLTGCNRDLDFGSSSGTGGTGGSATGGTGGGGTGGAGTCAVDGDCRLSTLHCDTGTNTCVPCVSAMNCTDPALRRCDLNLHRCVACVGTTDCATGQLCLQGRCVETCMDGVAPGCPAGSSCESLLCIACGEDGSGTCPGSPATPWCLFPPRICVGCRTASDCAASGTKSRCDPVSNTCVECTTGAECPAALPFCDPTTGSCASG